MITGVIKNKVDQIWLDIFSAGLANPLTVIEQLRIRPKINCLKIDSPTPMSFNRNIL